VFRSRDEGLSSFSLCWPTRLSHQMFFESPLFMPGVCSGSNTPYSFSPDTKFVVVVALGPSLWVIVFGQSGSQQPTRVIESDAVFRFRVSL